MNHNIEYPIISSSSKLDTGDIVSTVRVNKFDTRMVDEASSDEYIYSIFEKVQTQVLEMTENQRVNAVIEAARKDGYTQVHLIDKEFIMNAIRKQTPMRIDDEQYRCPVCGKDLTGQTTTKYCSDCGQSIDGAPTMPFETFGQRLRRIRREKKLSLHKLGELSGMYYQNIMNYEKDKNAPTIISLESLCKALGVSASELLGF